MDRQVMALLIHATTKNKFEVDCDNWANKRVKTLAKLLDFLQTKSS